MEIEDDCVWTLKFTSESLNCQCNDKVVRDFTFVGEDCVTKWSERITTNIFFEKVTKWRLAGRSSIIRYSLFVYFLTAIFSYGSLTILLPCQQIKINSCIATFTRSIPHHNITVGYYIVTI